MTVLQFVSMNSSNPSITPEAEMIIRARIRRIGKIGRICCSILLVLSGITFCTVVAFVVMGTTTLTSTPQITIGSWSYVAGKTVTGLLCTASVVFSMAGFWLMRMLFAQFTREELFTRGTARLIKWMGIWTLLHSFQSGPVHYNPFFILSGLFIIAFGWVMELAASLKEDQDLTV